MFFFFCFQAEDGIRDLVRSRGLGDVYKRQDINYRSVPEIIDFVNQVCAPIFENAQLTYEPLTPCLLYTSDAADERSSVDLGGRRIIKKKNKKKDNV